MGLQDILGFAPGQDPTSSLPLLLTAAGMAFCGLLLLPSAGYALLDLLGRPAPFRLSLPHPRRTFIALLPIFALGAVISRNPPASLVALPPLHVAAVGLSVLWLLGIGIKGLSLGSEQRSWGLFGSGMILAPFLSLLAELVLIVLVLIFGILYLAQDPAFALEIELLTRSLLANPDFPSDQVFKALKPFITQPVTLYLGLVVGAVLVPLVEEFFKPVGLWLLVKRNPTPSQGYAAGALSGAGFALFENFTIAIGSGEAWVTVTVARVGTAMIHILTTGLLGWALALAWTDKRYLQLGLTYLTSVTIHALWNGLVIISLIPELFPPWAEFPQLLVNIGALAPLGSAILLVGGFILLVVNNASLRRAIISPVSPLPPGGAPSQTEAMKPEPSLAAIPTHKEEQPDGNSQLLD